MVIFGSIVGNAVKSKVSTTAGSQKDYNHVNTGDECYLYSGTGIVVLARTKEAMDEFIDVGRARDSVGLAEMVVAHKLFVVDANCRAKLLEKDTFIRRVRISPDQGNNSGEAGWVTMETVHPAPIGRTESR